MSKVRVRFAPSPTGPLHMGGVRTALFNYLFVKKLKGDFILRVEDTDQTRYVQGAEDYIIKALEWCNIQFDEGPHVGGDFGPYRQSERKAMYRQYADQLIKSGHAYYAFDTPDDLNAMRERMKAAGVASPQYDHISREHMQNSLALSEDEVVKRLNDGVPYVIRIKIPRNEEVKVNDQVRGWVVVNSNQLDDKVLFKSDGMPTYHLANVVDDYLMKITHVIRGEEWLPSAPLHVLLYKFLGWENEMPEFAHLPLILKPDGNGKLSKRDGDRLGFPVFPLNWTDPKTGESSSGYKERGFLAEAFVNLLALLGWNPGNNEELFSIEQLIELFSIERVGKAGAKFNYEKALWFNQQHIRLKKPEEFLTSFKSILGNNNITSNDEFVLKVIALLQEKTTFVSDFWEQGSYFFNKPKDYDQKVLRKKWKDTTPNDVENVINTWSELEDWSAEKIEAAYKNCAEQNSFNPGGYMQLLRTL
ncbi:MAG: glutamate--tRNA ligase, partial [Bacteroidia bacterium]|nr:glutamate--tRNA ligase [Bacteroidia bacterium]